MRRTFILVSALPLLLTSRLSPASLVYPRSRLRSGAINNNVLTSTLRATYLRSNYVKWNCSCYLLLARWKLCDALSGEAVREAFLVLKNASILLNDKGRGKASRGQTAEVDSWADQRRVLGVSDCSKPQCCCNVWIHFHLWSQLNESRRRDVATTWKAQQSLADLFSGRQFQVYKHHVSIKWTSTNNPKHYTKLMKHKHGRNSFPSSSSFQTVDVVRFRLKSTTKHFEDSQYSRRCCTNSKSISTAFQSPLAWKRFHGSKLWAGYGDIIENLLDAIMVWSTKLSNSSEIYQSSLPPFSSLSL